MIRLNIILSREFFVSGRILNTECFSIGLMLLEILSFAFECGLQFYVIICYSKKSFLLVNIFRIHILFILIVILSLA